MNKICLIYTGGTIGMVKGHDGVLRPPENPDDFLDLAPEIKEIADITFVPLINKDSTNIVPSDWTKMAEAVYARRHDGYAGFVIAHGTDTMHFSASALAFALGPGLNFPVVFTGAQTTPDIKHGDARVNLMRALKVAQEDFFEVVISFGDYVFRGCRTQKKDEKRFDAFESPAIFPLADITESIIRYPIARKRIDIAKKFELKPLFANGILQVGLIPGLKPDLLRPLIESEDCHGIVLQSFGAGNVPDDGMYGFESFIKNAVENYNKPVVITSQFPANSTLETHYGPGVAAIEAGAIPTGNMTSAAATVKFRWVLARVNQELIANEITKSQKIPRIEKLMHDVYILEMDKS